jgi:hypothetical protein
MKHIVLSHGRELLHSLLSSVADMRAWKFSRTFRHAQHKGGQDHVDRIVTCYGLDSSRFEPRSGQETSSSPYPSILALGPTQPPLQWELMLFPGVKWLRRDANHPHPSSTKLKNEQSYTSTLPLPAWHVTGRPSHFQYKQTRHIHDPICQMLASPDIRKE